MQQVWEFPSVEDKVQNHHSYGMLFFFLNSSINVAVERVFSWDRCGLLNRIAVGSALCAQAIPSATPRTATIPGFFTSSK